MALLSLSVGFKTAPVDSETFSGRQAFIVNLFLSLAVFLAFGAIAGWVGGRITKGRGFGVVGNLLVGAAGVLVGSVVYAFLGMEVVGGVGLIAAWLLGAVLLAAGIQYFHHA